MEWKEVTLGDGCPPVFDKEIDANVHMCIYGSENAVNVISVAPEAPRFVVPLIPMDVCKGREEELKQELLDVIDPGTLLMGLVVRVKDGVGFALLRKRSVVNEDHEGHNMVSFVLKAGTLVDFGGKLVVLQQDTPVMGHQGSKALAELYNTTIG